VIRTLLNAYIESADRKYLQPIPRALEYLEASALPDGKLARFYELKTNRPLYMTRDYQLTYSSDDMPTHYAFIVKNDLPKIRKDDINRVITNETFIQNLNTLARYVAGEKNPKLKAK